MEKFMIVYLIAYRQEIKSDWDSKACNLHQKPNQSADYIYFVQNSCFIQFIDSIIKFSAFHPKYTSFILLQSEYITL